jgi:hypothetical protein
MGPYCDPTCGESIGLDFVNGHCRTSGIIAGVESVFIKPFYQGGGAPNVDAVAALALAAPPPPGSTAVRLDYTAAPRFWFGYMGESGLGARFRFFDYYQTTSQDVSNVFGTPVGTDIVSGRLALRTYDLEAIQQVNFRHWNLQGFGGVRYAQALQGRDYAGSVGILNSAMSFNGVGLTGGFQTERAVGLSGFWSMFVNGRGSVLFGNQQNTTTDATTVGAYQTGQAVLNDSVASIWEISAGPQWKRPLRNGGKLFLRTGLEAQYWQGIGNFAPVTALTGLGVFNHDNFSGNLGMVGLSAAAGISR